MGLGIDRNARTDQFGQSITQKVRAIGASEGYQPLRRRIAGDLVRALDALNEVEFMEAGALPFAVRVQCAFPGWPPGLQQSLVLWTRKNHQATLGQDRKAMSEIALEFERIINELLETRLQAANAAGKRWS